MLSKTQARTIRQQVRGTQERWPLIFNALADSGRFRIFQLLYRQQNLCVTDIANILEVSVPGASQQLRILELSDLVSRERKGQMTCYRIKTRNRAVKLIIKLINL